MESVVSCPICGNDKFNFLFECKDFTASKTFFEIHSCASCSFTFTNPRPGPEDIGNYYESNQYISHHADKWGLIPFLYRIVRKIQFRYKTGIIKKYSSGTIKLLDIGCGTGNFMEYGKSLGWDIVGIEPDLDARNTCQQKGLFVNPETFLNEDINQYSVITLWHVLEHVHKLDERLKQIKNHLSPGGIIVVAVPNLNSYDAKFYRESWAGFDVPRHLSHFNKTTLTLLFKKYGFALQEIFPMKYDAYYVSIKSEENQNRRGLQGFFRGVFRGFRSNISALRNKEYSSLIYVFKE